jgi:hypothetical protein
MKSVVNMLPEVATEKERRAFAEGENTTKIATENKGIKREGLPGEEKDYEKLDLKVELLLHHLQSDLNALVERYSPDFENP